MWLEQVNPQINQMWRGEWPLGFIEPARYLYDHELVCVVRGNFTLLVQDQSFEMSAGQFIIVPPNTHHVSETLSGKATRACIHFDWKPGKIGARQGVYCYHPHRPEANQLLRAPAEAPASLAVGVFDLADGKILRLLDAIFDRWESRGQEAKLTCRGLFLELLTQLYCSPDSVPTGGDSNRSVQLAYAVKDLLDQRQPNAQIGIQGLLETLGFSYAHLARQFQSTFGQSPLSYVNYRKLERARLLLDQPRSTIQEAADAAGYNDVSYFIRSFRRHFGQTPAEYRDGR